MMMMKMVVILKALHKMWSGCTKWLKTQIKEERMEHSALDLKLQRGTIQSYYLYLEHLKMHQV